MADSLHTQILGVYEGLNPISPCVPGDDPGSLAFWQIVTWGPVVTMVSAVVSSGAPAPGSEVFLCPGPSSTLFVRGTPSSLGVFNFTIDATLSNASHLFITCEQTVTLAGPPAGPGGAGCSFITLSPATLDDVFQTEPIAIQFEAEDGTAPYTWDLAEGSELPDGLALSSGGVLSGAATTPGSYEFTIRALDDDDCRGIAVYTLEVIDPDPIVVLPVPPLEGGSRGVYYEQQFTATGGIGAPYTFSISDGEIPTGLDFSDDGLLEGFPTAAGLFTFTVQAEDEGSNTGTREYTIAIAGLRIVIDGEELTGPGLVEDADLELGLNRQATGHLTIGDEYIPARGADVLIYARDGVTPIFGGLVLSRRIGGMSDNNPANRGEVDLVDYSIYFEDADPVTLVSTVTQDLEDVIAAIVAQSLAVYGITYAGAATGITVPPIEWTAITVPDAFKRITDATGIVFRVLPAKELDIFRPLDPPAPVSITDANLNAFALSWSDPPNLPRNTVDLLCGPTGNGVTTQQWTADGIETSWEVDIQAVIGDYFPGARSHAFLSPTGASNFAAAETVTLGSSTYTFRASLVGDVAGEVLIGADINASLANLAAAIVGAGGGVYAPSTPVNADADGYMRYPDQLAVNALAVGVAGDSIAVTTTSAAAFWYGEGGIPLSTLQLGADPAGAAGWTQGYILENGATAQTLGSPGSGATYEWDVTAGRGTVSLGTGTTPAAGTLLELVYLAVFPFHARVPSSLPPGTAPVTFREDHPEIVSYADGIALATQILVRESANARELEVFTDVDGFMPGQELEVDTTYRGGLVASFLVATVRIHMVNAELWEYRLTTQETDEYAGSYVEQWKALTSGGGSSASSSPGTLTAGGAIGAGDIYRDGRNAFTRDQSLGGNELVDVGAVTIGGARIFWDGSTALQTDKEIRIASAGGDPALFGVNNSDPSRRAFATDAPGDLVNRFTINVNGEHWWGLGAGALDTHLYRTAAGVLTLNTSIGAAIPVAFVVSGDAGQIRGIRVDSAGLKRWLIAASAAAESGGNVGSDLVFTRYDDAGASIDSPVVVARVSGFVGVGPASPLAKLHISVSDASFQALFAGTTKALRIGTSPSGVALDGTDPTGTGSYQPVFIGGSTFGITIAGVAKVTVDASGDVALAGSLDLGSNAITNVADPTNAQDAATKAYVDANIGGGGGADVGFMAAGAQPWAPVGGPMIVTPTGTTLTFLVSLGVINVNDSTNYATVQLQDFPADDAFAVIGTSLVSFGGQSLAGLVHLTGLTAGKQYVATLQFSSRRTASTLPAHMAVMVCLDLVTAIAAASIETAEAGSSGTFGDLATPGPTATITIPTNGVMAAFFGDSENRVQTGTSSMQLAVSGANTITLPSVAGHATSGAQNLTIQSAWARSRLASGSTSVKLQYASDGGSNTRYGRWMALFCAVFGDAPITKAVSSVQTAETTTSTIYAALTTADSVTLTTGTSVLVLFSVNTTGSGTLDTSVAVAVSGATTIAAADGVSNAKAITANVANATYHVGRGVVLTVNAGSNTFALRYKVSAGTGTFSGRVLAVIRLN